MSTHSAAGAYRAALVTAMETLFPTGVMVTRGDPAFDPFPDVITVGSVAVESDPATFSSNLRTRDETLQVPVRFMVWREGGEEAEAVTEARAYEMFNAAETYVRVTDTKLGGAISRHCFVTSHAGDDVTPQDLLHAGRLHVIEATFTAINRISGS